MTEQQRAKIIFLRASGLSFDKIVKETGVSKQTVFNTCDNFETQNIIREQRQSVIENILSKERVLFTDRLESLGKLAGRLRTELEIRELKDLSTDCLCKIYFQTLKTLGELQQFNSETEQTDRVSLNEWTFRHL